MKKIILLAGLLLASGCVAFADCDYECVAPYNMNSKFRTVMGAVTGANSITEKKVESILKKEVLKIGSADELKIDLDSYSPKDLKNGIFKSVHISGKNVVMNDIHLASLDLKTLCDFNYIKQSGDQVVFVEALPMSFNLTMNESSLNSSIKSAKYQKIINDLNNLTANYGIGLKVSSTKVAIKNGKFYFIIGFEIPFVKNEHKLVFETNLKVKNGKIDFYKTKIVSGHFNIDIKIVDFLLNHLNPLDFSVNILDKKDANIKVKNVEFKNGIVYADGVIVIPKDNEEN